uniref:RNase H type-1 domain-containing protein n=1 Tax=Brassica oleracea var. oleracea TaxID=109376 RepID=A0A0D3DF54_BRAOL
MRSLNLTHIWVRSDSQVLVRAINRNRGSLELHGVLSDIAGLASSFTFCFFSFVPRNSNGPANALAKICLANFESSGL